MSESPAQMSSRKTLWLLVTADSASAKLSLLQRPHFQMGISIKDRILHSFVLCSCKKKTQSFQPAFRKMSDSVRYCVGTRTIEIISDYRASVLKHTLCSAASLLDEFRSMSLIQPLNNSLENQDLKRQTSSIRMVLNWQYQAHRKPPNPEPHQSDRNTPSLK